MRHSKDDYKDLTYMSIRDALDVLADKKLVHTYLGNLLPDSPYEVDFDKARFYMAIEKLSAYLDYTEKQGIDLDTIIMDSRDVTDLAPCSRLEEQHEIRKITEVELTDFLETVGKYTYTGKTIARPVAADEQKVAEVLPSEPVQEPTCDSVQEPTCDSVQEPTCEPEQVPKADIENMTFESEDPRKLSLRSLGRLNLLESIKKLKQNGE